MSSAPKGCIDKWVNFSCRDGTRHGPRISEWNQLLDLKLSIGGAVGSSVKVVEAAVAAGMAQRKDLYCRYCEKKFPNPQALGGHQNAHKHERGLEMKERMKKEAALAYMASRFYPLSTLSPYNNNRLASFVPLGVQKHSAIHKPFNSSLHGRVGHGYGSAGSWSIYSNPNRRLSLTGNPQEAAGVNTYWADGGVGVSGGYLAPPRTRSNNLGGTSSTAGKNRIANADHLLPRDGAPEKKKEEEPEIDLTLRL